MGNDLFFGNNANGSVDGVKFTLNEVYIPVRVESVVFDETHPRFIELGGYNAIGTIEFSSFRDPFAQNTITYQTAKPFFPNIKQFPCQNEIVLLIQGVDAINSQTNVTDTENYYLSILNIWNTPHQNAIPNPFQFTNPSLTQKDYQTTLDGSPNVFESNLATIPLGPGFFEQTDVHPSKNYPGDLIFEGRWGQSIRFGSTAGAIKPLPKTNPISKSYIANSFLPSGDFSIPQTFKSDLSAISSGVKEFKTKYPNYTITIVVSAGESLVTNPNNLLVGAIAQKRLENVVNLLQNQFPLLYNSNIITQTQIGDTPYTVGIDSPQNEAYKIEQFINVNISLYAVEYIEQNTIEPSDINEWSTTGNVGDPITIIKNGQSPSNRPAWVPLSDLINTDDSSIYLTSTQKLPLEVSSVNDYFSYKTNPPTVPKEYAGKQIILNSGRLVFNTNQDHLLLSSAKSINFNAVESINFDTTGNVVVQSNKLYLGSKNAEEPLLLGNATVNLLGTLLNALKQYVTITQSLVSTPTGTPLVPLNIASTNLLGIIEALDQQLDFITSKDNFTI